MEKSTFNAVERNKSKQQKFPGDDSDDDEEEILSGEISV